VSLAATVNMAGGQPVSMANVKALRTLCDRHGIRIFLDATRLAENAFFIQERETGYTDTPIAEIVAEFASYTDGAWMSSKKDSLVNIGGWLAVNDDGSRVMSRPSNSTLPSSGAARPATALIRVDFPAPFEPMMVTKSPAATERSMRSSAVTWFGVPRKKYFVTVRRARALI
jgi:hypothetical protein